MDHGTFPKIMGSKLNHRTQICHCHLDAAHTSDWREAAWVKYLKHRTATLGHSVPRTVLCSSQVGTSVSRPFSNWFYNVSSPVALWWSHMVCLYVGRSWNSQGRVWFVSMQWHLYIHRNLLVHGMRSCSYKMQVASGSVSQHHARNTPRYLKKKMDIWYLDCHEILTSGISHTHVIPIWLIACNCQLRHGFCRQDSNEKHKPLLSSKGSTNRLTLTVILRAGVP